MKIPAFVKIPVITLTLVYGGSFGTPQAAQAHHHPVHSTEQTITKVTEDTSVTAEQVAVNATANTHRTLPLAIGGVALLSLAGLGSYKARKQQSV